MIYRLLLILALLMPLVISAKLSAQDLGLGCWYITSPLEGICEANGPCRVQCASFAPPGSCRLPNTVLIKVDALTPTLAVMEVVGVDEVLVNGFRTQLFDCPQPSVVSSADWIVTNGFYGYPPCTTPMPNEFTCPQVQLLSNSTASPRTGTFAVGGSRGFIVEITQASASLSVTTASLPNGNLNAVYPSQSLTASGGSLPYSWSILSGSLPDGLTLDSMTGAISGTPTKAGTFNFTVRVTDATAMTAQADLSIMVFQPGLTAVIQGFHDSAIIKMRPSVTTSTLGAGLKTTSINIQCQDNTETIVQNCTINFDFDVVTGSGGHVHGTDRPTGHFTSSQCIQAFTHLQCNTGSSGTATLTYTAPEASGTTTATGTVTANGESSAFSFTINVQIDGLILSSGSGLIVDLASQNHGNNNGWASTATNLALNSMAAQFEQNLFQLGPYVLPPSRLPPFRCRWEGSSTTNMQIGCQHI